MAFVTQGHDFSDHLLWFLTFDSMYGTNRGTTQIGSRTREIRKPFARQQRQKQPRASLGFHQPPDSPVWRPVNRGKVLGN